MNPSRIPSLVAPLLALVVACAPADDGLGPESADRAESTPEERAHARIPSAAVLAVSPAPEPEPVGVAACEQELASGTVEREPSSLAPGVRDPRYRVVEDPIAALRDASPPPAFETLDPVSPRVLAAQRRYLAEVADDHDDDPTAVRARARRKAEIMGQL